MSPRTYSDEGIILARRNYGETDRIIALYSKNHGRISLIAKGVRHPTSKKRGHIEIFSLLRFQAVRGKGLDLMTEAEIIDFFSHIRKNLKKVALAYYFMEVIGRVTHENEPHREVFDLVIEHLNKLREERRLKKLRLDFISRLLIVLGFWPKGKPLANPDAKLEEVIERNLSTVRVGRKMLD